MKQNNHIIDFVNNTIADNRISKGHVALYVALIYLWAKQSYCGPLHINSREIMPLAKISSSPTYHNLIRQLAEYGYIEYKPSFYRKRKSLVYIT
jgi:DNA-binding MarR family transcriptional regulator